MATAKDFVDRVNQIEGIAGCVLIRNDGVQIAKTLDDQENYVPLLQTGSNLANDIMESIGFSYCRYLSFDRENMENLYVFPVDNYLLGIPQ